MRKDKKKVIGEDMTDKQVLAFLDAQPPAGINADFHALERAYRGLRAHDFERFVAFFIAAGRSTRATDPHGRTLAEVITHHAGSEDYVAALTRVGNP